MQNELLNVQKEKATVEGEVGAYKIAVQEQTEQVKAKEAEITELKGTITNLEKRNWQLQKDLAYGTKAEKDWVDMRIKEATQKK